MPLLLPLVATALRGGLRLSQCHALLLNEAGCGGGAAVVMAIGMPVGSEGRWAGRHGQQ